MIIYCPIVKKGVSRAVRYNEVLLYFFVDLKFLVDKTRFRVLFFAKLPSIVPLEKVT